MSNAKNLFVILARDVTTDATDNMTTIGKIIDKFTFGLNREELKRNNLTLGKSQINLPATYFIATSWLFDEKLDSETLMSMKVNIINPAGKNMDGPEQEGLFPRGINRININFSSRGLPVTSEGQYILRAELLSKNGKLLAYGEYPFEVEFSAPRRVKD